MNILLKTLQNKLKANPTGLYILFYTEMWELFGRFGITALLVLYLTNIFHISDAVAFSIYSAFIALTFATPILGGYLADRYLGSKHAIVFGAVLMIVGDALMVIPDKPIVFIGLATVAVGCGFFLPSIPPLVSALYENKEEKRDAGFTLYYLGKNLGALIAPVLCGIVGKVYGLNYAFVLSTLGMVSGIVIFLLGQKHLRQYNRQPLVAKTGRKFLGLNPQWGVYALSAFLIPLIYIVIKKELDGYLLAITGVIVAVILGGIFFRRNRLERKHMLAIFVAILFMMLFSAFLGQGGTTLNLFIERGVHRELFGYVLPPSFFYSLDPIFMLIMGPILAGLWMRLAKKRKEPSPTTKFAFALFILGLGFLVFVVAAHYAKQTGSASSLWVVLAYFLFPVAELMIIPVSLSLITKLAPKGLESLMVGIWMLSNAGASYFTGQISKVGQVNFSVQGRAGIERAAGIYQHLFALTATTLVVAGVVLLLLVPLMKQLIRSTRQTFA